MTQAFFPIHTLDTVRPDLRENLETVKKNNGGYIPNLIGLLAILQPPWKPIRQSVVSIAATA